MFNICIFEDYNYKKFYPLTECRPCYNLLIGCNTIYDKLKYFFPESNIFLHCRNKLKKLLSLTYKDSFINNINSSTQCLFINGRILPTQELIGYIYQLVESAGTNSNLLFTYQGQVIAAYFQQESIDFFYNMLFSFAPFEEMIKELRNKTVMKELESVRLLSKVTDFIQWNNTILEEDFQMIESTGIVKGITHPFASIQNENNIFIDNGSIIEDFVLINAKKGPVYFDKNVYIESGSRIEGPVFLGEGCRVNRATIKGVSAGKFCKLGGEISNSIIYQYSNKGHYGFLGDSYVGEWVNLGAGTTTSNLKNTYGEVSLRVGNEIIKTERQFCGAFIGDYVKTGIGTMLNTGTHIGCGAQVFGTALHSKYIPSFSWGESNSYSSILKDKFFEVTKRVMQRRNIELHDFHQEYLSSYYDEVLVTTV